mmetsp:Transcript_36885/g.59668  ORF Transcript_36885/g.59668 Transcript_36885/m.59668 type:complete len:471 (+) Transcript_36885:54-1466(+)
MRVVVSGEKRMPPGPSLLFCMLSSFVGTRIDTRTTVRACTRFYVRYPRDRVSAIADTPSASPRRFSKPPMKKNAPNEDSVNSRPSRRDTGTQDERRQQWRSSYNESRFRPNRRDADVQDEKRQEWRSNDSGERPSRRDTGLRDEKRQEWRSNDSGARPSFRGGERPSFRGRERPSFRGGERPSRSTGGVDSWQRRSPISDERPPRKFPLKGAEYLYGISPISAALTYGRRKFFTLYLREDDGDLGDADRLGRLEKLAKEKGVAVQRTDKGMLNVLTDNKVHQGAVLDVSALDMIPVSELEAVEASNSDGRWPVYLALDQVQDVQNFGALLRSAYFLGIDGVVVCRKNSAPLTAAVSKASAGAAEAMEVKEVNNMPNFLELSKQNGWTVLGTSMEPDAIPCGSLSLEKPAILVLGNEGHGLRTNVKNMCDMMICIPGKNVGGLVDSLNVSVAGGILLSCLSGSMNAKATAA